MSQRGKTELYLQNHIEKEKRYVKEKVRDLRSALELLQSIDGQLVETDVEVDPLENFQEFIAMLEQVEQ